MKKNCTKIFRFVKRIFISTMMCFGCNLSSVNPLESVSMNSKECKVGPEILNVNSSEPLFYLLVLKQVNAVVLVTASMIPMQNCVFLMLLKT